MGQTTSMGAWHGRLYAVIDFGYMAIGNPACDLVIAWNVLNAKSHEIFKQAFNYSDATWHRAHGWALWKARISKKLTSAILTP